MTVFRRDVIAVAATLCCVPVAAAAQQAAILGIVADSGTGRPLENVAITLDIGRQPVYRTLTDRNGFYQIPGINPGTYTLQSRRVGYQEHVQTITLAAGEQRRVSVRLAQLAVALEGLEVTAERGAAVSESERQVVTPEDVRLAPVPGGSGDLVAYLQTL
ncbi:MAG: carboxypeptidase-like regulatory domain-containing protein, partial [Gemmatimonadota bacterium]